MNKLTSLLTIIGLSILSLGVYPLQAQISPSMEMDPNMDMNMDSNIDDLPGDAQQLTTWRCNQDTKTIAVEAKDEKNWKSLMETDSWQCAQDLSIISSNDRKFTCEPNDTIGILTVFWLEGQGGKQQMQKWVDELAQQQGLICTLNDSSPSWE